MAQPIISAEYSGMSRCQNAGDCPDFAVPPLSSDVLYFGDINDFRKYALLMHLAKDTSYRIGVCWMLTPNDDGSDGSELNYLHQADTHRHLAPELFDALYQVVIHENDRRVARIELAGLLPHAIYHSDYLPDAKQGRQDYFHLATERLGPADFVFFDPDNGFETRSTPLGQKRSSKYLFWSELQACYEAGKSPIVYQHFPRRSRLEFINELCNTLAGRTGAKLVFSFATRNVVFVVAPQPQHEAHFRERGQRLVSTWRDHFTMRELPSAH